jgi:hypothetical protein
MGQFSWITQDTFESIRNNGGESKSSMIKRKAYLHDNKGNVWEELDYEGYGVFGGKDFFQLVAEMNNLKVSGDVNHDRELGIDLWYSNDPFLSPNLTRSKKWEWVNKTPQDCPNQGWSDLKHY